MRQCLLVLLLLAFGSSVGVAASQAPSEIPQRHASTEQDTESLRITSPLGRTGVVTKVRIVAQVKVPQDVTVLSVAFFVDGVQVGTVDAGPPYAVDWIDENPFEQREIIVEASESTGRMLRDTVMLPPYEVTERSGVTGILLETSVYDKAGRFVSLLEPSAFTVTESGVNQTVDLATRETTPTDLLLLVDNSQSMSRRMDIVRRATVRLAASLRPHDRAIVVPFNAHIGVTTGPTDDAATIAEAIGAMRAGGGTALLDSLVEGTRLLQGSTGRRAIVLITDGYDENSATGLDDVIKTIEQAQVTVYVVAIGGVAGISLKGGDMLRRIADRSGGRVFFPFRESEIVTAADAVAIDAHSRYLITYTPSNQTQDGTWRPVVVGVPEGYHARTRAGYFAPAPPPIRPTIEFTVMDRAHQYVDVTADELEVLEEGVPQAVDTFQEAVDPVSIVLALDSSGSMKKSADLVRATARDFVLAVRAEDSLALLLFADVPTFSHVLATNRQRSLDAIAQYSPDGGTALYDALWNSLMELKDVPGRRAIVVLTDGRDENNPGTAPGSVHHLDEVLALGRQIGATIFTVGLGLKLDRPVLEQLATESGGQAYFASDGSTLGDQFQRVVEDLRRRYVLGYTSTDAKRTGKWRTVEIRARTPGRVVSSGGGYFAPDPQ